MVVSAVLALSVGNAAVADPGADPLIATGFVTDLSPLPCGKRAPEPQNLTCETTQFLFPQPTRYDGNHMVVALSDILGRRRWFDERLIVVDTGASRIGTIDILTR